jgi:hypothetical protein
MNLIELKNDKINLIIIIILNFVGDLKLGKLGTEVYDNSRGSQPSIKPCIKRT